MVHGFKDNIVLYGVTDRFYSDGDNQAWTDLLSVYKTASLLSHNHSLSDSYSLIDRDRGYYGSMAMLRQLLVSLGDMGRGYYGSMTMAVRAECVRCPWLLA